MILNIMDAANDVDNRAAVAKSHFRNRTLAVCTKQYPEIGQLPVPIQKLLAGELDTEVKVLTPVQSFLLVFFIHYSRGHGPSPYCLVQGLKERKTFSTRTTPASDD